MTNWFNNRSDSVSAGGGGAAAGAGDSSAPEVNGIKQQASYQHTVWYNFLWWRLGSQRRQVKNTFILFI